MRTQNALFDSTGRHGVHGYQAAIAEVYAPMVINSDPTEPAFPWSIRCRQLGAAKVSHVVCSAPVRADITPGTDTSEQQNIVLMYMEEGSVDLVQGHHQAHCDPKMLTLMNVGKPLEVGQRQAIDILSLTIPTQLLRAQFPEIEDRCGIAVPAATGTGAVLRDFLKSILREHESIDDVESRVLSGMLSSMVGCVSRLHEEVSPDSHALIAREYANRLRKIIDEELQNPDLSPPFIAARLGISLSYLYSIARNSGISVSQLIIDNRLDRCHAVLADRAWLGRSITEIAFSWGFQELSHFSRRFSERFGMSPKAYRKAFAEG